MVYNSIGSSALSSRKLNGKEIELGITSLCNIHEKGVVFMIT